MPKKRRKNAGNVHLSYTEAMRKAKRPRPRITRVKALYALPDELKMALGERAFRLGMFVEDLMGDVLARYVKEENEADEAMGRPTRKKPRK